MKTLYQKPEVSKFSTLYDVGMHLMTDYLKQLLKKVPSYVSIHIERNYAVTEASK